MSSHSSSSDAEFPSKRIRAMGASMSEIVQHGAGASTLQLASIEHALSVKVRNSMCQYLVEFGWVGIGSTSLRGIGPNQSAEESDIVDASRFLTGRFGRKYLAINNDGGEFEYALPVAADGDIIDRIVVLPIHGGDEDEGWPSGMTFSEFVSCLLDKVEGVANQGGH